MHGETLKKSSMLSFG